VFCAVISIKFIHVLVLTSSHLLDASNTDKCPARCALAVKGVQGVTFDHGGTPYTGVVGVDKRLECIHDEL
jgi:hypothetical protein